MRIGYIYKIVNCQNNYIYIGSTDNIQKRYAYHLYHCYVLNKHKKLYEFMKKYDINDFKIEIIKQIEYDNDSDLKKIERTIQDENKEFLLNKNRAYITIEEKKEMKRQITKQYFINNPDYAKNYYAKNKFKILEKKNYLCKLITLK
jgi:predicted GIY-YIG superfamily endonuclease